MPLSENDFISNVSNDMVHWAATAEFGGVVCWNSVTQWFSILIEHYIHLWRLLKNTNAWVHSKPIESEFPRLFVDFFDDSRFDWCEVISHCSFDLHFSNN